MKRLVKLGFALAAATVLAGTAAKADIVTISWSSTMNSAATFLAGGSSGTASFSGAINSNFNANNISGTAAPDFLTLPALLASNSFDVTGSGATPGTIFIWVTDSSISAPLTGTAPFVSSLTSNTLTGTGTTLTLQTFYDMNNGIANQNLATDLTIGGPQTFTTGPLTGVFQTNVPLTGNPYSIIAMYEVTTASVGGSANATINVSVPGPIVGAGLPGLLAACGGLIALARRRRQQRA